MRYCEEMSTFPPGVSAPEQHAVTRESWWKSGRSIAVASLVTALIAVAVAVAAWLHPSNERASYSDQQSSQAKKNVCMAALAVNKATFSRKPVPNPTDPINQVSDAANSRLALLGGGAYLRDTVDAEPATSADLASAVKTMAETLQQMGVSYVAGTTSPAALASAQQSLDKSMSQINRICGFKP